MTRLEVAARAKHALLLRAVDRAAGAGLNKPPAAPVEPASSAPHSRAEAHRRGLFTPAWATLRVAHTTHSASATTNFQKLEQTKKKTPLFGIFVF
jgi:hypothetical protein